MFKNRAVQVKMVKTSDRDEIDAASKDEFFDKVVYAQLATKDVLKEGTKVVATYVVLDTLRQLLIKQLTK